MKLKPRSKRTLFIVWILFLVLVTDVSSFILGKSYSSIHIIGDSNSNATMTTAAHIPETELSGYSLIYKDIDHDIAIYRNLSYEINKPNVGDKVSINKELEAEVIGVDTNGFFLEVKDFNEIVYGLSGVSAYASNGDYLGFVSYLKGEATIYCISY